MGKFEVQNVDSVKMYKIRKTLDELTQHSGRGTELISVYIPKGQQLHEIMNQLREEQGTADNIKSDLTRTHVVDSLSKVIQKLKLYKKTPDKGLVVFCGALPREGGGPPGSEVVKIYEIDPPKDLTISLYRCDDHFHTDILKEMLQDDNVIGLLAIDAKDAGWGLLHGDKLEVLKETGSGVAGKHRQGGQSAKRFQKLREMELQYFFNRVAETTREYFIDIYKVKGLIVSGPGPTKEDFIKKEAFAKCGDILSNFRMVEEKKIIEKVFQEINTNSGLGSYGLKEVIEMLKNNIADMVVVSDDINMSRIEKTCKRCSKVEDELIEQGKMIARKTEMKNEPCSECKSMDTELINQDLVDYIALIASQTGTKVEVVSGKTEHGVMLGSLGNIAAILRYNPNRT